MPSMGKQNALQIVTIKSQLDIPQHLNPQRDEVIVFQKLLDTGNCASNYELLALSLLFFNEIQADESHAEQISIIVVDKIQEITISTKLLMGPSSELLSSIVSQLKSALHQDDNPGSINLYFSTNNYIRIQSYSHPKPTVAKESNVLKELNQFAEIYFDSLKDASGNSFLNSSKLKILSLRNRHLLKFLKKTPNVSQCVINIEDLETRIEVFLNESDSCADQEKGLKHWKSIFDSTYNELNASGEKDLFHGWQSTSTGKPIPVHAMKEWIATTMEKILISKPARVLELGAGSGMIVSGLMSQPFVQRYLASDLSQNAIDFLTTLSLDNPSWKSKLELELGDSLAVLHGCINRGDEFDIVILNSVVQYFPNIEYFTQVLDLVFQTLVPGGRFFIGDIRNVDWLGYYLQDLQIQNLEKSPQPVDLSQFLANVKDKQLNTFELLIGPKFFWKYTQEHNGLVSHFYVELHGGEDVNEMTCFRYNVSMFKVGVPGEGGGVLPKAAHWNGMENLEATLSSREFDHILYCGFQNGRVFPRVEIIADPQLKADFITQMNNDNLSLNSDSTSLKPFIEVGKKYGYSSRVMISTKHPTLVDILYYAPPLEQKLINMPIYFNCSYLNGFSSEYFKTSNNPSKNKELVLAKSILTMQIRKLLRGSPLPLPILNVVA